MRRLALLLWLVAVVVGGSFPLGAAPDDRSALLPSQQPRVVPGARRLLLAGVGDVPRFIAPARAPRRGVQPADAMIEVVYHGFSSEARAAFQYAVDLWAEQLTTSVPIKVEANWEPLGAGILGAAGPHMVIANWGNAPQRNTWYPIPLANQLAGRDLIADGPDHHDIDVFFNSSRDDWYFGTSGSVSPAQYDFVSVVLHELGHGFGFSGSMDVGDGQAGWGLGRSFPIIYDRFTVNGAGQHLIDTGLFPNPSTRLLAELTSDNIFWDGERGKAATGGARPKLFAPRSWNGGSSYSHLDEATYRGGDPNSLMTPYLGRAEAIHDPGPITRGMLEDLGWEVTAPSPVAPAGSLTILPDTSTVDNRPVAGRTPSVTVTNSGGTATRLRLWVGADVLYDGSFVPDEQGRMTRQVVLPARDTCANVTISGTLEGPGGTSPVFVASMLVDGGVDARATAESPPLRPARAPILGPSVAGDAAHTPANAFRLRIQAGPGECTGLSDYTITYVGAPGGAPPAPRTATFSGDRLDLLAELAAEGGDGAPPGTYSFFVDLQDRAGNRRRYPSDDSPFRITLDQGAPVATLPAKAPPYSTTVRAGVTRLDLRGLRVADDWYPDQGSNQAYWGYWVLVAPGPGVPSDAQWLTNGVVVRGLAAPYVLWRVHPVPTAASYRIWIRALDGAGNASNPVAAAGQMIANPHTVNLPLVTR